MLMNKKLFLARKNKEKMYEKYERDANCLKNSAEEWIRVYKQFCDKSTEYANQEHIYKYLMDTKRLATALREDYIAYFYTEIEDTTTILSSSLYFTLSTIQVIKLNNSIHRMKSALLWLEYMEENNLCVRSK